MIYDKDSMYYQLNQAEPEDMERHVPMTIRERTAIRFWVRRGHSVESNPWDYRDSSGEPMNFLQAYRIRFGYVRGPWDYWHGEESCTCFHSRSGAPTCPLLRLILPDFRQKISPCGQRTCAKSEMTDPGAGLLWQSLI